MEKLKRPLKEIEGGEAPARPDDGEVANFEAAYGEPFSKTLDLDTWTQGEDLAATYARIEEEIASALAQEGDRRQRVRDVIIPRLKDTPDAPPNAGIYQAPAAELERIHPGLLFNGRWE